MGVKRVSLEDFVGHWIGGNDRRSTTSIEDEIVHDRLIVRAIADIDGELADIQDLTQGDEELRFVAYWSSGQTTAYRLRRSDDGLEVHFTSSNVTYLKRHLNPDGTPLWRSGILHVAPGDSAAGSLRWAIRESGRSDNVIGFIDDLSCGPIASDDPVARSAWWASMGDWHDRPDIAAFWKRIMSTPDRLIVWFSRHSAREHAFYLSLADRLGERPYDIIDVTGLQLPTTLPGGQPGLSSPKLAVSLMHEDDLALLFGTERAITIQERENAAQCWRRLKSENAPFRIVTQTGLVSAPDTIFDDLLLQHVTKKWRRVSRVIGETLGYNMEPFIQTGDVMLQARVVALVGEGKLIADGDPWERRKCHVRLPDHA
jgi:hypothetical protein